MVKSWFKKVILAPQLWLGAAALSVAASLVIDYIDAQKTADHALALRQGPPPVTALQDFQPATHVGPAREVIVRAETDLGQPVVVTLGSAEAPRQAVIYPLFPLSERGRTTIRNRLANDGTLGSIRPMPRPDAPVQTTDALGVILYMTDGDTDEMLDANALIARHFGSGRFGSVVEVNGERIAPGDMSLVVKGAMAARNIAVADGFLAVAPYVGGRLEALAPPRSSGLQRGLLWGGILLGAVGLVLSWRAHHDDVPAQPAAPRSPGSQDTRVSTGTTVKARTRFQTIPTQDEIYASARAREAREAREADSSSTRKLLDGARSGVEKIKNRR